MIPGDEYVKESVAFSYGNSKQCDLQSKRKVVLGDVASLHLSKVRAGTDDSISRNAVTVKVTVKIDEESAMSVRLDYSVDAQIEKDNNKIDA